MFFVKPIFCLASLLSYFEIFIKLCFHFNSDICQQIPVFVILRYFIEKDGKLTTERLFEEWFYCTDLGAQLAPVIKK